MKKKLPVFLCIGMVFFAHFLNAQSVSPKVIASAGGAVTGGTVQVSRTVGETVISSLSGGGIMLSQGFQQTTSLITLGSLGGSTFCAGAVINVPFIATDITGVGNIFTAQLSNSAGDFSSSVSLGTLAGNASGTINGTIPSNTPNGNGYRIRVVSSSPVVTSADNGSNLTMNATLAVITQPSGQSSCTGQNAYFSVTATGTGLTYRWQENRGAGWNDLADGGIYSGTSTANLSLIAVTVNMNTYQYRCVINSTCNNQSTTSTAVVLNVRYSGDAVSIERYSTISGGVIIDQAVLYFDAYNKIINNANVNYLAGNSIVLHPGFEVQSGSVFTAKIAVPCSSLVNNIPLLLKK